MALTLVSTQKNGTVILFGGKGSLQSRYREVVEASGYAFQHYEARLPQHGRPLAHKIALVIVVASMISHPLMAQARLWAGRSTRIVYVKNPSITAVRRAIADELLGSTTPAPPHAA